MSNYPPGLTNREYRDYFESSLPIVKCDSRGWVDEQEVTPCVNRDTCNALLCDDCYHESEDGECKQCRAEELAREQADADNAAAQIEREKEARVRL